MALKKNILCFLVLQIMLLAQFGLAAHAGVHYTDHGHAYEHQDHDDGDQNPHKNLDDLCQIFLSAKSFSHGLISQQAIIQPTKVYSNLVFALVDQLYSDFSPAPYHARGPPSFLI